MNVPRLILGFTLAMLAAPAMAAQPCTARAGDGWLLVRATLLLPVGPLRRGEVLVNPDGEIECAGRSCRAKRKGATIIDCPDALLSPGFINLHEHLGFGHIAPTPDDGIRYTHRHDWRKGLNGFRQREDFAATSDPAFLAWFELRHLLGGETSIVGGAMAPGLVRNLDFHAGLEGVDSPRVSYETFPFDDAAGVEREHDCDYGAKAETTEAVAAKHALLIHLGEGTGEAARNEFRCASSANYDTIPLPAGGGTSQDILFDNVTVLHGIAFDESMLASLAERGVDLVWSPRSNLSLYGQTLDLPTVLKLGVTVALGTDWLPSGSMTLVREAACASAYSRSIGHPLSSHQLWTMMTSNGAHAARMSGKLGVLAPGSLGDLILIRANPAGRDPYETVISAAPPDILMVVRGGRILAGDAMLLAPLRQPGCEQIDMGSRKELLCIQHEVGLSYATLQRAASAADLWPAFFPASPPVEPVCEATSRDR